MAAPKGHPRYGGRSIGTPNKQTADIKALAQVHGPAVVARLLLLSGCAKDAEGNLIPGAESEATQVTAMRELLDRGYGKSTQPIAGDPNAEPIHLTLSWQPDATPDAPDAPDAE